MFGRAVFRGLTQPSESPHLLQCMLMLDTASDVETGTLTAKLTIQHTEPLNPMMSYCALQAAVGARTPASPGAGQRSLHAVIADENKSRNVKWMYGELMGLPIVRPSWVKACAAAQRLLPMDHQHVST